MLDARFGFALRIAARRAWRRGQVSEADYRAIRGVVRNPIRQTAAGTVNLLEEAQREVLEEAFCRTLVTDPGVVPQEIDCEQLIELFVQLLPLILALFGL